ncbi:MAG: HAD family hydrolase [Frankiaceae bacterium]
MPAGLRAVIFDWGGTLTPWHNVDVLGAWSVVARELAPINAAELAEALHRAERDQWHRAETEHRSSTIHEVIAASGIKAPPDALERALDAYLEHWDPHTHTDVEVKGVLAAIRERGLRVGVLSNTHWPRAWHERIFARDGVLDLIDGDVYTSEIAWTKPHPEAFRAALRAVGCEPAEAVFVGDRPFDDIHGAKSVGMRAVLVPHSNVPAYDVVPDGVVQRLSDLLPLLDGWLAADRAG